MKISEKYLQKLNDDLEGEQGIIIEEIKLYGEICRLEERYLLSGNEFVRNETLEKLNQKAKENNL